MANDTFERSFALFDADGRLLEWDQGFVDEFRSIGASIACGASFRDLLIAAWRIDGVIRAETARGGVAGSDVAWADEQPVGDREDHIFEYQLPQDRTASVRRHRLASGGWLRLARAVASERAASAIAETADDRWSTEGDPTIEAIVRWRIEPDGSTHYFPGGEDIRTVWGLPDDIDMADHAAVFSRMISTPAEMEAFGALIARTAETLEPAVYETRVRDRDDRWRWLRCSLLATREPGGVMFVVRMRDVTREKLAEDQLELLRLAVTQASDAIQILNTTSDQVTTVLYANPAFEDLLGWRVEDVIGRPAPASTAPETGSWHAMLEMATRGDEARVELPSVHRDGRPMWLEASAKIVERRPDGSFRWVLVSRNIDERRRAQENLRRARDAAEAAVVAKSEFLANMSHEIRTPLTSVIGFAELLRKLDGLSDVAEGYVQRISTAGQSLLSVINDVLDFSKLEAGQVDLDPHPFDPAECVEAVVGLLSPQAVNKGVELDLQLDDGLPELVMADSARIRQVLMNLVGNAVKFTKAGQVSVSAAYKDEGHGEGRLKIAVTDTGPGIAEDMRHRLFQRFSQIDGSIGRHHGGSGLGLAICKSLVDLMGGDLGVDSELGRGSTFWFSVPVVIAAAEAEPAATPDCDGLESRPAHILLVDDVAVNRELVRAMLTPLGHTFEDADNGADAVKAAMRTHFDLILMDLQMPGMDGFAAARAIRATAEVNRDTPILALSANVLAEHLAASRAAGMDDHIAKPIQPVELLTKVAIWTAAADDEPLSGLKTAS